MARFDDGRGKVHELEIPNFEVGILDVGAKFEGFFLDLFEKGVLMLDDFAVVGESDQVLTVGLRKDDIKVSSTIERA